MHSLAFSRFSCIPIKRKALRSTALGIYEVVLEMLNACRACPGDGEPRPEVWNTHSKGCRKTTLAPTYGGPICKMTPVYADAEGEDQSAPHAPAWTQRTGSTLTNASQLQTTF